MTSGGNALRSAGGDEALEGRGVDGVVLADIHWLVSAEADSTSLYCFGKAAYFSRLQMKPTVGSASHQPG